MTAFMLQVTDLIGGRDRADEAADHELPDVRDSRPKSVPVGADEQMTLRALAEQLVSEANAVLHGGTLVELTDELLDGQLAFQLRYGARSAVLRTQIDGDVAFGELLGVGGVQSRRVELAGPGELQRLILLLIEPAAGSASAFR